MDMENKEEILSCIEELEKLHNPRGLIYQSKLKINFNIHCSVIICTFSAIHSYKAMLSKEEDELETIYNLAEVHSPDLRNKTVLRYEKLLVDTTRPFTKITPMMLCRQSLAFKCPLTPINDKIKEMLKQLEEMPKGKLKFLTLVASIKLFGGFRMDSCAINSKVQSC